MAHGSLIRINVLHTSISPGARGAARKREGLMFTRRQAIRWAELWLSCWNEGDFDTLLALYRDTTRFGGPRSSGESAASHERTIDALKRHWAALPFGIHSTRGDLERVSWDPETRELTIVYATDFGGTRLHGCDLLTLDSEGRVVLGEPCVGVVADDEPEVEEHALVHALRHAEGGR
jgi:hypothetical protein